MISGGPVQSVPSSSDVKAARAEYQRQWRAQHPEKVRAYNRKYYRPRPRKAQQARAKQAKVIVLCAHCKKRVPPVALKYGDPFCSRECAEIAYGTRDKTLQSLAAVSAASNKRRAAA